MTYLNDHELAVLIAHYQHEANRWAGESDDKRAEAQQALSYWQDVRGMRIRAAA